MQKLGIGCLAEDRFLASEIEYVRAHVVHEHPVVGNENQDTLKALEKILKPLHCVYVQVVGGLVQKQDVCASSEHPGQFGPLAPAAGKLSQGTRPLSFGKAQAREHGLGSLFRVVAYACLKLGLLVHEFFDAGLVSLCLRLFPVQPEFVPVVDHIQNIGDKWRFQGLCVQLLFHIAQAHAGRDQNPARIRHFKACNKTQQR